MKAVLFDLDGTLVDSLADIADAMNEALAGLGLAVHPRDAYRAFVGEGATRLAEKALPAGSMVSLRDAVLAAYRRTYAARMLAETVPYEGVPEVLAALAESGMRLGVLSNKPDDATRAIVAALFGGVPFSAVAGERPGTPRKPHPEAALSVLRVVGVAPADAVLVGDTRVDVETARAAGLRSVGVTWGFRPRAELEAAGADVVVDTRGELIPAIRALG